MPVANLRVVAGADDAREDSAGTVDSSSNTVTVDTNSGAEDYAGIRFQSVTVPQGATIVSATFKATSTSTKYDGCSLRAYCEDVDSSQNFVNNADITGRTKTTNNTLSDELAFGVATDAVQVDVTSAVQEVVDRSGWSSGNDLTVLLIPEGTSGNTLNLYSYEGSGTEAGLDIEYKERVYADSFLANSGSTNVTNPTNANGAPDTSWTANSGNESWIGRWSITNPSQTLRTGGTHTVTVPIRKSDGGGGGNPQYGLWLFDNGTEVAELDANNLSADTGTATGTFNTSDVSSGSNIEIEFRCTAADPVLTANDRSIHIESIEVELELEESYTLVLQAQGVATTVDNVALTQAHTLSSDDVSVGVSADTLTLDQTSISSRASRLLPLLLVSQEVTLTTADASVVTTSDSPSLTQAHSLSVDSQASATSAESTTVSQAHVLVVQPMAVGVTAESVTPSQAHTLTSDGLSVAVGQDSLSLTQAHDLSVAEALSTSSTGTTQLSQAHSLEVASIGVVSISATPELSTPNELGSDPLSVASSSSEPDLVQSHTLAVNEVAVSTGVAASVLVQDTDLGVGSSGVATSIAQVQITQSHTLTVDPLLVGADAESVAVVHQYTLSSNPIDVASSVESVALTESVSLSIDPVSVAAEVGAAQLAQAHTLVADGCEVEVSVPNISLGQANELLVDPVTVASEISQEALQQAHVLGVDSISAASALSTVVLESIGSTLNVNDLSVSASTGALLLGQSHILAPTGLNSASAAGQVVLASTLGNITGPSTVFYTRTNLTVSTDESGTTVVTSEETSSEFEFEFGGVIVVTTSPSVTVFS